MENIILYRDFNQTKKWSDKTFEVEFKGNRARVKSNSPFSPYSISRFNKLTMLGKTTKCHYVLTVDGKKVFFMTDYDIYAK